MPIKTLRKKLCEITSIFFMTQINNSLVKLENVGVFVNDKWLVKGVSFEINKGQLLHSLARMDLEKLPQLK